MRTKRSWKTVRILEGRLRWLMAIAGRDGKSASDLLEEILGEYEASREGGWG
jgi:hypothetical protein